MTKKLDLIRTLNLIDNQKFGFFTTREMALILGADAGSVQSYLKLLANNLSALKRMAFLSEKLDLEGLSRFRDIVLPKVNAKYTLLDPCGKDEGPFHSKWKIRNNSRNVR